MNTQTQKAVIWSGLVAFSCFAAANATAELGSCVVAYQDNCCDWLVRTGGINIVACNANNDGSMCDWTTNGTNALLWFIRGPFQDEHGHRGSLPSPTGKCDFKYKKCKNGVCDNSVWWSTSPITCTNTGVEDTSKPVCPP